MISFYTSAQFSFDSIQALQYLQFELKSFWTSVDRSKEVYVPHNLCLPDESTF